MPRTARPLEKEIFVKGQHLRNIMKVAISLLQSIQLSPCQTNGSAPTAHLGPSSLSSPRPLVQVQVPKQWTSCLVILPFLKSLLPSSFNLLSSSSSSRLLPAASYPASPQPLSRRPAPPPPPPPPAAGGRGLFVPLSPLSTAHRQAASLSTGPFAVVDVFVVAVNGVVDVVVVLLASLYPGLILVVNVYFSCCCSR